MGPGRGRREALAGGARQARGGLGTRPVGTPDPALAKPAEASEKSPLRTTSGYAIELAGIALVYFVFAKVGLALASLHPSASPIWPPTGLALAAVMLRGPRVWPAILIAAGLANLTNAGSLFTSLAIAVGNTAESLIGGYLIGRFSGGLRTFETPAGVARFALIALLAATPVSASIGVGSLAVAGYVDPAQIASTWMTWWLGDLAGALVITPVFVLWAGSSRASRPSGERLEGGLVLASAVAVGLLAFSPLLEQTANRDPLGFLAVLPLMWAALRRGQRDTATVALVLSAFAIWGTVAGEGPFARATLNNSFLVLLMYLISTSVPTLALSADVAVHKRTERRLRKAHAALNLTVQERTSALEEARGALLQAQKMEALGQLTGGIAHDFNNVLTVIMNSLEAARASADRDLRQRLDRSLQAARSGASLVQQLLVFARQHPLRVTATEVNELISSAIVMFSRTCPESIEIRTDLARDLRWATADATQVQTAILNLAVNARDAMPAGGSLSIVTRNLSRRAEVPAGLPPGDYISITVTDTGLGMSPEVLARAFEPFFTTKEIGKGTGLGLAMVYSTIRQMGGDIEIESRLGHGTTVRLILPAAPLAASDPGHDAEMVPAAGAPAREPVAVLYVEDDALVSLATVDLLEGAGYVLHTAPEAARALQVLDQHPEIGLLVTDIGLPGMDGHELAAEARRRRPDLRVLFLSGYDRRRALREPADLGMDYLDKPYSEAALFQALRRLADGTRGPGQAAG